MTNISIRTTHSGTICHIGRTFKTKEISFYLFTLSGALDLGARTKRLYGKRHISVSIRYLYDPNNNLEELRISSFTSSSDNGMVEPSLLKVALHTPDTGILRH